MAPLFNRVSNKQNSIMREHWKPKNQTKIRSTRIIRLVEIIRKSLERLVVFLSHVTIDRLIVQQRSYARFALLGQDRAGQGRFGGYSLSPVLSR